MMAVILAGGEGTRLRPLSANIPKPMVPILNRPFLEHVLERLRQQGVDAAVLTLCYRPEQIRRHFGNGRSMGLNISYTIEETPLGTAGAIKAVADQIKGTFLVLNGDIFTDLDVRAALEFHRERGAKATIVLTHVKDPTQYGVVQMDRLGRIRRFVEKPKLEEAPSRWINAGTYVLEPDVLEHIPSGEHYMFERGLFPKLLDLGLPVYGYRSPAYWLDLGTPTKYMKVHWDILNNKAKAAFPGKPAGNVWVEEGCDVHESALATGAVVLGKNCHIESGARIIGPTVLGPGSSVGSGAMVQKSILWSDAKIGKRAKLTGCIVGRGADIGAGAVIGRHCIIADDVVVKEGTIIRPGSTLYLDATRRSAVCAPA